MHSVFLRFFLPVKVSRIFKVNSRLTLKNPQ